MRGGGRITFLGGARGGYTECARAYHDADQTIGTGASTPLAFNSERFDTDGIHDNVTNNERLTCKTKGVYQISATVRFAVHNTGRRDIFLQLNGVTAIAMTTVNEVGGSTYANLTVTTLYAMEVNDYVRVMVYQNRGGDLDVLTVHHMSPEFMMVRVG